jgi:predicted amidophosphoribosyltransferase
MIHFCPNCWSEIRENVSVCPHCRYDLAHYNQLPYEDKLILALRHPIRENRMLAIQLLGDLRSRSAISVFRSIIREENDFYVIREVVRSLRKIGGKDSEELLSALRQHTSKLVRDLVVQK